MAGRRTTTRKREAARNPDNLSPKLHLIPTARGPRVVDIEPHTLFRILKRSGLQSSPAIKHCREVADALRFFINEYLDNAAVYRQRGRGRTREEVRSPKKIVEELATVSTAASRIKQALSKSLLAEMMLRKHAQIMGETLGGDDAARTLIDQVLKGSLEQVAESAIKEVEANRQHWRLSIPPRADRRLNIYACHLLDLWQRRLGLRVSLSVQEGTGTCSELIMFVQECFALVGVRMAPLPIARRLKRLIESGELVRHQMLYAPTD